MVAPVGTVTVMLVALHAVGVAAVPLKATVLLPCDAPKSVPVIVIVVPTVPEVGLRLPIEGMDGLGGGASALLFGVEAHPCCREAAKSTRTICRTSKAYFERALVVIDVI